MIHGNLSDILLITSHPKTSSVHTARMSEAFILDAMPQEALAAFGSTFALQVRSAISHVSSWDNVTNLGTFERNRKETSGKLWDEIE